MLFNLNVFQIVPQSIQKDTSGIAINAPARKVYRMLTDVYELSKWGAQKVGIRHVKLNNILLIIIDEAPDKYVEWRFLNLNGTLNYSTSFELSVVNGYTLLNFSKKYWCGDVNCEPDIDWENQLLILKSECEKYTVKSKLKITSVF